MKNNVLIVGASGGIASALIEQYCNEGAQVYAVSRAPAAYVRKSENVLYHQLAEQNDKAISDFVKQLAKQDVTLTTVVITTGFLHRDSDGIHPEKRLEDVSEHALAAYFETNSIIPALWLKHLVNIMSKEGSTLVCLSARVGSISDNGLGGWYGYRASKAALNMLVKTASVEYKRRLKDVMLVCYHPGTVDTDLSKPFQKNVAAKKLFTAAFTAKQLIHHLSVLNRDQACHFIDWNGEVVTW
ncbi:oxidoreductase, short-chain dehydrogenase/reductase family protein [Alteromonas macleodii str. 'Black Sea 11']|nr:oxidoreductase, short-chain dehydrogenase/reductase family protein [Alteromonas macleodii str. 'Black Sea 11']NKW89702.1 SDR family NAD(P)-dependent oxidoreductase [Alteromonadaceae bacterium A_SAG4]NKX05897.1 SDR family NAD(P)-dependent oxidoreductase [Alteromonadaceae bacterium A_SAG6]NKX18643.1 SDR family NAD(P)-dependent oxidoreductase [Alteromonadaceae bacterium A_SAG5]NKX33411.1 SDR family NAD(P)-dependent oxidoreductase [Alteromonadaceae bacterium A_SAG3]NKX69678.1 SDR family NAD(P)-|tara:strand:+ start:468 stop:1193 length:726 start_codon:yes stop_codon:yes gene_type:complete